MSEADDQVNLLAASEPISEAERSAVIALTRAAGSGNAPEAQQIDRMDTLRQNNLAQDIELKKFYARGSLFGVGIQLLIADAAFFFYLVKEGNVPSVVMDVWLSATVVQSIGIVLVITNYLFPATAKQDEK